MDNEKVIIGSFLLVVSTIALLATTSVNSTFVLAVGAIAPLVMAAGALLVGISGEGRPV